MHDINPKNIRIWGINVANIALSNMNIINDSFSVCKNTYLFRESMLSHQNIPFII